MIRPTAMPRLSIIIPAFNEEKLLGETLRRVQGAATVFAPAGWEYELIVCDNNSTDRTAEIGRAAGATVVFEPVNQIARARNCGAAAATGEWLLFIDADSHPSPELFQELLAEIGRGRAIAGGCVLRLDQHHGIAARVTEAWNWFSRWRGWAAGSFVYCETAAFRAVEGFSPELFAGEEIDLCNRLKRHGRKQGRRMTILTKHPLITSSRKLALYSPKEHLMFLFRTVFTGGRTLRDRQSCFTWYDGRR